MTIQGFWYEPLIIMSDVQPKNGSNSMEAQPRQVLTPEEYLANERLAEFRSEFVEGEVIPRVGSNRHHCQIATNLLATIGGQLRDSPFDIYSANLRVKIVKIGAFVYPDLLVELREAICGDDDDDVVQNPTLIVEILSPATEAFDRGRKFEHYQTIESLREYLLVAQEPQRIELYTRRAANEWLYTEFRQPDDIVRLESIGCELLVRDVYHKV
jgi:Uma2 family endonuclease